MSILITRPSPAGEQLANRLNALGYTAYHTPLIEIIAGRELDQLNEYVSRLKDNDFIVALSPNAVNYSQNQIKNWPNYVHYLAIGQSTAQLLQQVSQQSVSYPQDKEISEHLLALPELQHIENKYILILRGNGGRELIGQQLKNRGANIQFCECYQRIFINYDSDKLITDWQVKHINIIVVTSNEMLQQLYRLVSQQQKSWLLNCQLIVVSQRIANNAYELGWHDIKIAKSANNDALIEALK